MNSTLRQSLLIFLTSILTLPVFSQNVEAIGNRMVELMNESRAVDSIKPLVLNPYLNEAAKIQAEFLNTLNFDSRRFSHKNPNPQFLEPYDRVKYVLNSHNYKGDIISMGENITFEYTKNLTDDEIAFSVHQRFMKSPGHRLNIMSSGVHVDYQMGYYIILNPKQYKLTVVQVFMLAIE